MIQIAVLVILGILNFGVVTSFSFLSHDDQIHIYNNLPLINLNYSHFWLNTHENLYIPLTYTIWTGLNHAFGPHPAAFHAAVLFFHIANAVFLYRILINLKFSTFVSFMAAAIFMCHPTQVESFAWSSSLKDTAYLFFSLASFYCFMFLKSKSVALKSVLVFTFTLSAILCKPTAVVLPVFFFLAYLISERHQFKNHRLFQALLAVQFLIAGAIIYMTRSEQLTGIHSEKVTTNFIERIVVTLDAVGFYLKKVIYPVNFYPDYGRYPRSIFESQDFYFNTVLAAVLILLSIVFIKKIKIFFKKNHYSLFLFSTLLYLPTSGLVAFSYQHTSTVADRYMYGVMAGIGLLLALGIEYVSNFVSKKIFLSASFIFLTILCLSSRLSALNWRDQLSFALHSLEGNPKKYSSAIAAAKIYFTQGEYEKALVYFTKASSLEPKLLEPIAGKLAVYFVTEQREAFDSVLINELPSDKFRNLLANVDELQNVYVLVARHFFEKGEFKNAQKNLCNAEKQNTQNLHPEVPVLKKNISDKLKMTDWTCEGF